MTSEAPTVGCGTIENGRHVFALRVYFEDTDAAGIVYYANYLKFTERARTEMLRCLGLDHTKMIDDGGIAFAVRGIEVQYLSPARLEETLVVETRILDVGGATLQAEQIVSRDGKTLVETRVRLACIHLGGDKAGRPARIPKALGAALSRLTEPNQQDRNDGKQHG